MSLLRTARVVLREFVGLCKDIVEWVLIFAALVMIGLTVWVLL